MNWETTDLQFVIPICELRSQMPEFVKRNSDNDQSIKFTKTECTEPNFTIEMTFSEI